VCNAANKMRGFFPITPFRVRMTILALYTKD